MMSNGFKKSGSSFHGDIDFTESEKQVIYGMWVYALQGGTIF